MSVSRGEKTAPGNFEEGKGKPNSAVAKSHKFTLYFSERKAVASFLLFSHCKKKKKNSDVSSAHNLTAVLFFSALYQLIFSIGMPDDVPF